MYFCVLLSKFVFIENLNSDESLEIEYRISEIGLEGLWLAIRDSDIDQDFLNAQGIGYIQYNLRDEDLKIKVNDINFKGNEFTWIDEGETRDDLRMSDAFQVRVMLNEEFNIRTHEAQIQHFTNLVNYQTLITLNII